MQRIWLARAAAAEAPLRRLARSARRDGFAPALEALLTDLQASGLDARGFARSPSPRATPATTSASWSRCSQPTRSFATAARLADDHQLAARTTAALRSRAGLLGRRGPSSCYGFDDLTREQVELVDALARRLRGDGRRSPSRTGRHSPLAPSCSASSGTSSALTVTELARAPDAGGGPAHAAASRAQPVRARFDRGPSRRVAAAARGRRRPGRGGADRPQDRAPARRRASIRTRSRSRFAIPIGRPARSPRTLGRLGIPLAPEASVPLAMTATGSSLFELLAIVAGEGTAATVVSLLRRPARARPDQVDWLERAVLRGRMQSAEEALSEWAGTGESPRRIWALDALREAGDDRERDRRRADPARRRRRREAHMPIGARSLRARPAIELRAATEVGAGARGGRRPRRPAPQRAAELAELLAPRPGAPLAGPDRGPGADPQPLPACARRGSRHLFVAGLADGTFPAAGGADPLLSDERRRALGLHSRSDPAAEERYLFYACVSKPDALPPPLLPGAATKPAARRRAAPSSTRCATCSPPPPTPDPADDPLEAGADRAGDAGRLRAGAGGRERSSRSRPRPGRRGRRRGGAGRLRSTLPDGRRRTRHLRGRRRRGAGSGGSRAGAAQPPRRARRRWRARPVRRLDPRGVPPLLLPLVRQPRARSRAGSSPTPSRSRTAASSTRPSSGSSASRPASERPARRRRASSAGSGGRTGSSAEVADERGWDLERRHATISLARLDAVLDRFLRRDAATGGPLMPDPSCSRPASATGPATEFPAADLGEFRLRGRSTGSTSSDRYALIRDYKLSAKVTAGAALLREGKLQLPLYMLAARGFGLEPIGGLYSPLGASKEDRPRGLLDKEHKSTLIPGETSAHYGTDFKDPEGLEEILDQALDGGDPRRRRDPRRPDRSQPAGRLLPDLVRIRSDLPGRARDPRAGRGRGGGRGLMDGPEQLSFEAPPAEDPPSPAAQEPEPEREPPPASEPGRAPTEQQQPRSTTAIATSSSRRAREPARPGSWSTVTARRSTPTRSSRTGSSPSPSPRRRRRRCAVASGSSSAPRAAAAGDPGAADQAAGGRAGGRGGPDHDDPRILPAPARRPPGRGRPRSAVPGARRRRGIADRRDPRSRRRSRRSPPADDEVALTAPATANRLGVDRPGGATPTSRNRGVRRAGASRAPGRGDSTAASEPADARRGGRRSRAATRPCAGCWSSSAAASTATRPSGRRSTSTTCSCSRSSCCGATSRSPRRSATASTTCSSTSSRTPARSSSSSSGRCAGPETRTFTVGDARAVDLRLPRRRPRQLPARAGPPRRRRGRPGHGDARADRQLPLDPRRRRGGQRWSARRCSTTIAR